MLLLLLAGCGEEGHGSADRSVPDAAASDAAPTAVSPQGARAGTCVGDGVECEDVEAFPFEPGPTVDCAPVDAGEATVIWAIETPSVACGTGTCDFAYSDVASSANDEAWVGALGIPVGNMLSGVPREPLFGVTGGPGPSVTWAPTVGRPSIAGPAPRFHGMRAFTDGLRRLAPNPSGPGLELQRCPTLDRCEAYAPVVDKAISGAAAFDADGAAIVAYVYDAAPAEVRGTGDYPPSAGAHSVGIAGIDADGNLVFNQSSFTRLGEGESFNRVAVARSDSGGLSYVSVQLSVELDEPSFLLGAITSGGNVAWVRRVPGLGFGLAATSEAAHVLSYLGDSVLERVGADGAGQAGVAFPSFFALQEVTAKEDGSAFVFDSSNNALLSVSPENRCKSFSLGITTSVETEEGSVTGDPNLRLTPGDDVLLAVTHSVAQLRLLEAP